MHVTIVKHHIINLSAPGSYAVCSCEARFLCKEIDNKKIKAGIRYKVLAAKVHKGIREDLPDLIGVYSKRRRGWYRTTWVDFIDELFVGSLSKEITITRLYLREEGPIE